MTKLRSDDPLEEPARRALLRNGISAACLGFITEGLNFSLQSSPSSAITDVPGIKVGHFTDTRRPTGCTVILTEEGAVGAVDVRGAAPGTRETDLLNPINTVQVV